MELTDGRVDKYEVNIIIENFIDHIDDQIWDTGILEEIVAFCREPNVDMPIEEQAYTNVNGIHHPVITTKGWDV